jgi:hypothetical protein
MNDFFPETSSDLEWRAARSRLEDYLRAWRLANGEQRDRIVLRVLERAARKQAEHRGLCPTVLVMKEIRADLDRWFEQHLASPECSPERSAVKGFVAWFALDAPEKWPAAFLAQDIPADFQQALLASNVRAAPDLRIASMLPQPFANPLRAAIQLPAPVGKLARELAPLVAKATAAVLSALSILSGVRLR